MPGQQAYVAAGLAVLVALAGCADRRGTPPPARTAAAIQADDAAAADILEHHRHHHHGGTLMLVAMSLDDLGLPPDEEARVAQIQADLLAKMGPSAEIERGLATSLAEGIASLMIDPANIEQTLESLAVASAAAHAAATSDLEQLHAILTPPQRAALVDKVEAQWALWKRANVGDQRQVATISKEIGLWPAQIDKVQEQLTVADAGVPLRQAEVERHLRDFESAFQSDHFDPRTLPAAGEVSGHLAGWGAARLARYCEVVNPLLVPEQRDRLVALLREHAGHDETQAKE